MNIQKTINAIENRETYIGIELGSTRIKAVMINKEYCPISSGSHTWENRLENGIWTYSLDDIWNGLRDCFANLNEDVQRNYGIKLEKVGAIGISAMMHGYMAFNAANKLLVPYRTWRNTITGEASKQLTNLFGFNIPQRWSVALLYQAILNGENHVPEISFLTTLAGYIHWQLTGEKVLGLGDASGMFPLEVETKQFDPVMLQKFDELIAGKNFPWRLIEILPHVLPAGESAGTLSEEGARLIDPTGMLKAGIPLCPPEGDAGTGMVATNSIRQRTGNISAGTSIFAMSVLEKPLTKVYPEIDIVTTPSGDPVAMVHCNNCTGEIDGIIKLFGEAAEALGAKFDTDKLYFTLFNSALNGDSDCGGLVSCNYVSGEPVTGFSEGIPFVMRLPNAKFNLSNLIRAYLFSACATLKIGMDILFEKEHVVLDVIAGHGGFFIVPNVGQRIMATALGIPVSVLKTAGEGGPWGMAILAAYMKNKKSETLCDYLSKQIFANSTCLLIEPDNLEVKGFKIFMERYRACLKVEETAVEVFHA